MGRLVHEQSLSDRRSGPPCRAKEGRIGSLALAEQRRPRCRLHPRVPYAPGHGEPTTARPGSPPRDTVGVDAAICVHDGESVGLIPSAASRLPGNGAVARPVTREQRRWRSADWEVAGDPCWNLLAMSSSGTHAYSEERDGRYLPIVVPEERRVDLGVDVVPYGVDVLSCSGLWAGRWSIKRLRRCRRLVIAARAY